MLTKPIATNRLPEAVAFARHVFRRAGARAYRALAFLLLGSLTEGISILLMIPLLHLLAPETNSIVLQVPAALSGLIGPELSLGASSVLIALVALVFVQSTFMRFKNIYTSRLLNEMMNGLRVELIESIGRARWQFIVRQRGADLNHLLTADVERVQSATFHLLLLIQNGVLLLIYFCVSTFISLPMTLFAVALGGAALAVLDPIRKQAASYGRTLTENHQAQFRIVTDFLAGAKVAKSLNAEPRLIAKLASTLERMRRDHDRFVRLSSLSGVVSQSTTAIGAAVFIYAALTWFALSLPVIVVLIFLFMRVTPRIIGLQIHIQEILVNVSAFSAIDRMLAACAREQERADIGDAQAPSLRHELTCDGVVVRYGDGGKDRGAAVSNASFTLPARAVSALIGPSGSGKTTLADVLMGLLEIDDGRLLLDGEPLNESNRRAWREHVAYVPQDVFLLHDTIEANLRLAAPEASEMELWRAVEAANARDFVERLPNGLHTVVGDRGALLSGGERQRIALARALLRRPELLILDEATSALDWANQKAIAEAIQALRETTTIVIIAHRPSMIAFADWVVALENGRVTESGPYDELVSRRESRLSQMLLGEQI